MVTDSTNSFDSARLSAHFASQGWCRFGYDPALANWVDAALPVARRVISDTRNREWLRYGDTWFAGVNVLPNDAGGMVDPTVPLSGAAVDFAHSLLGVDHIEWDQAQVSVCYPGYPKPMAAESEAAFRYRLRRDAAHVDGILREGPLKRRYLRQYHGFVLGIPLVESSPDASPFVVWEGSHEMVRLALKQAFNGLPPAAWAACDITELYHQLRRDVFARCKRIEISAKPGEAYLTHRLSLHGMAPWGQAASSTQDGRMICYFRPEVLDPWTWVNNP